MTDPIRLLLVDDHALVRDTLSDKLDRESSFKVVGVAADADEAFGKVRDCEPDIVLMDIDMPGLSCFDAAQRIMTIRPDSRMIFLSAFFHDHYIDMALRVKAKGYVTKSDPLATLVKAIKRVAAGRTYFSPDVESRIVVDTKGTRLGQAQGTTRTATLSPREVEVLRYIARGTSKKTIAHTMHVSVKTVDAHAQRLMNKLDIHDRVELARFAIREGLAET